MYGHRYESSLIYLVVSEHERSLAELLPALLVVEALGGLQGDVDVHALQRQGEASLLVLDEVQGHLDGKGNKGTRESMEGYTRLYMGHDMLDQYISFVSINF